MFMHKMHNGKCGIEIEMRYAWLNDNIDGQTQLSYLDSF